MHQRPSSLSLVEVVTSFCMDELKLSRKTSAIGCSALMFLTGIPAAPSFGVWSDVKILGKTFFDLFDFLSSNVFMPLGGVLTAVLAGWVVWHKVEQHLSSNGRHTVRGLKLTKFIIAWVAPVTIGVILVKGL